MRGIISDQQPTRPNTRMRVHAALDYVYVKVYCAGFIQIIAEPWSRLYRQPLQLTPPFPVCSILQVCRDGECGGSEGSAGQADHRTRTRRPPLTIAARIVCAPRSSFVPRRVGEKGLMYPATARDRTDSSTAGCRRKQGHCLPRMSTANWAVGSLLCALPPN